MRVRVSYIIPVYNGEKHLVECLDSLYQQGLPEESFEVICIDDCSSDSSVDILKKYANAHSNVKLILNEQNKKTGSSCNCGLNNAKGDYLWIIGQDDWIENNRCGELLDTAEAGQLDLLLFNYSQKKNRLSPTASEVEVFGNSPVMSGKEFVRFYFKDSFNFYLLGFEWRTLFRREFLMEKQICFPDETIYEDTTFLFRALWYAGRVQSLRDFVYNYRINTESVTAANKRYQGALAYEFAFVAGKEVLDLSEEIIGTPESSLLYQQALWYFKSFVYKVVPMPIREKMVFYGLVRRNWASVNSLIALCPIYVRCLANPIVGCFLTTMLKPAYMVKHSLHKKEYDRGI